MNMIFDDVLQELIDLHEQTRCGCSEPTCRKCRDDAHIEDTIGKGLRLIDPLDNTEREQFEVLKKMFYHTVPEKMPDTYFICGDGGSKDDNNLPEFIFICPAYGVGHSAVYKRNDNEQT